MDEIQKYLTEELQSAKEEKENLEEQIHKIDRADLSGNR